MNYMPTNHKSKMTYKCDVFTKKVIQFESAKYNHFFIKKVAKSGDFHTKLRKIFDIIATKNTTYYYNMLLITTISNHNNKQCRHITHCLSQHSVSYSNIERTDKGTYSQNYLV